MDRRMPPITRYVRSIEGNWMTLGEVARALRVPPGSLYGWRQREPERFRPGMLDYYGKIPLYLYSEDDVERIRKAVDEQHRRHPRIGRPRSWSTPEQQERSRQRFRASYYEKRALMLTEEGELEKAAVAAGKSREIRSQLHQQATGRDIALGR